MVEFQKQSCLVLPPSHAPILWDSTDSTINGDSFIKPFFIGGSPMVRWLNQDDNNYPHRIKIPIEHQESLNFPHVSSLMRFFLLGTGHWTLTPKKLGQGCCAGAEPLHAGDAQKEQQCHFSWFFPVA